MKQFGRLAAFTAGLYVLQTSLLPLIAYRGISPDLMLLLTVSFAFLRGARQGGGRAAAAGALAAHVVGGFGFGAFGWTAQYQITVGVL